jgi:hypothetical protein
MEIHAVQVLGPGDHTLDSSAGGATLVDSETGSQHGIQIGAETQAEYATRLSEHISSVRQHCLAHQISFTSAKLGDHDSPEAVALATISSMGLFV